jgi:hypothetical protein
LKSFESETFADRITRLLGPQLRDPARTQELLGRLSNASRSTPQPSNCDTTHGGPATQMQLFERASPKCEAATLVRSPLVDPEPSPTQADQAEFENFYDRKIRDGVNRPRS